MTTKPRLDDRPFRYEYQVCDIQGFGSENYAAVLDTFAKDDGSVEPW